MSSRLLGGYLSGRWYFYSSRSSCRRNEAAFDCEAIVKPDYPISQKNRVIRFYDDFVAERSLVPSAAATGNALSASGFMIQGRIEIGALLQVFLGVGRGFLVADQGGCAGRQGHGGRDGASGNHGEKIEIHDDNPRRFSWRACLLRP